MKPVALISRAVANSSSPGNIVYDPFCGSGSTLIAAEETGRRAFTMEIAPVYCDVIIQRWEQFSGGRAELIAAADEELSKNTPADATGVGKLGA